MLIKKVLPMQYLNNPSISRFYLLNGYLSREFSKNFDILYYFNSYKQEAKEIKITNIDVDTQKHFVKNNIEDHFSITEDEFQEFLIIVKDSISNLKKIENTFPK
jgi:hypothetical protein